MRFGKYLPNITIYAISVVILVLVEVMRARFEASRILSPNFIFNVTIPSMINLMILLNTAFMYKCIVQERNELIIKKENTIAQIIDNDITSDFDDFFTERTLKKKKIAYKSEVNAKIGKLDKKASIDSQILWNNKDEEHQKAKESNQYCIKKKQFKELLDDDYIDKNIMYLQVEYKPITKSQVFNNYKTKTINDEDDAFEDLNKRTFKDVMPSYFQGLLFLALFSVFIPEKQEFTLITLIAILVKLVVAIWNYFNGKTYMEDKGTKAILNNLDTRLGIFKEYITWKNKKKGDTK